MSAKFDDLNLVLCAGLVPVLWLVGRAKLHSIPIAPPVIADMRFVGVRWAGGAVSLIAEVINTAH